MSSDKIVNVLPHAAPDGVIIIDGEGRILAWNSLARTIFGWEEQEVVGRTIAETIMPSGSSGCLASLVERAAQDRGSRSELIAVRRDATTVPIDIGLMPGEYGGTPCLIAVVRSLSDAEAARTALEVARERLAESEERYRHIVELSGMIAWTADRDGLINSVNDRWREWTGAPQEAALGRGWESFLNKADAKEVERRWSQAVTQGETIDIDYRLRRADGGYRWVSARARKRGYGDPDGTVWYGTLEDIHDRRLAAEAYQRTETELARVARLGAMGAMASAIAHDLNQPLTAAAHYVRGSLRLSMGMPEEQSGDLRDGLAAADRSIVHAADIVRKVREFVTRGATERHSECISDVVEQACRFALTDAAQKGVSVSLSLTENCRVMVDRVQLQQVIVNLVSNAIEAMRGCPRRELTIGTIKQPDGCEVSISDTGPGVPASERDKLFDPFYTTRANGMGVGLSISRSIVEAHGGAIWLDPRVTQGATFRIKLPFAEGSGTDHDG